jgi:cephalosporin hydroxylase
MGPALFHQLQLAGPSDRSLTDDMVRLQALLLADDCGDCARSSLVFSAGLCQLMGKGRVIGVDIEIRPHNRAAIESHPLASLITLVEGDSVGEESLAQVRSMIEPGQSVLVILDSCHSRDHVMRELEAYSPLVTVGSYIVATDGVMDRLVGAFGDEPDWDWNNPRQAAQDFSASNEAFVIDRPKPEFDESVSSKYRTGRYSQEVKTQGTPR